MTRRRCRQWGTLTPCRVAGVGAHLFCPQTSTSLNAGSVTVEALPPDASGTLFSLGCPPHSRMHVTPAGAGAVLREARERTRATVLPARRVCVPLDSSGTFIFSLPGWRK